MQRILSGAAGRNLGLIIALVLLIVVGAITAGDRFMNVENFLTIIRFASIIGVISIGMTFVITAGRHRPLGRLGDGPRHGRRLASWVQTAADRRSWLLMVAVALAVGGAAGLINGIVIAYGKWCRSSPPWRCSSPPAVWPNSSRTDDADRTVQGFLKFFRGDFLGIPWLIWIFVIAAVVGWFLLSRTTFGRRTVAIGGNFEATRLAGIRVKRHLVALYVLVGPQRRNRGRHDARPHHGGHLDPRSALRAGCDRRGRRRWHAADRRPRHDLGTVLGVLIFATLTNVFTQNNLSTLGAGGRQGRHHRDRGAAAAALREPPRPIELARYRTH